MIGTFLILFRETLEAALVVGIVLGYLYKSQQMRFNYLVLLGVTAGIAMSLLGAFIFNRWTSGFTGRTEEIFEGVVMLAGAGLITTLIFWIMSQGFIILNFK